MPTKKIKKRSLVTKKQQRKRSALPGIIELSRLTAVTLWRFRRLLAGLLAISWVLTTLVVGATQQSQYESLRQLAQAVGEELFAGDYTMLIQVGVLFTSVLSGGLNTVLGEGQQIYLSFAYAFVSLVTIWILRHRLAGESIKLRDAIYRAGGPIAAIVVLSVIAFVQLLPFVIGTLMLASAKASGLLSGIAASSFIFGIWGLSFVVSLYLLITTFFAIIIATLPGMYPIVAYRDAQQLLRGKRMAVFGRIVWLIAMLVVVLGVAVAPLIFIDAVIGIEWLSIVAALLQLLTIMVLIYATGYVYMLYRELIDDTSRS